MKKLLLPVFMCMTMAATAQNALLKNPIKGAIVPDGFFYDICMVSNGKDVVLVAADKKAIYAMDIADNNAANAGDNAITSIPNFLKGKLEPVAGKQNMYVIDIEVNPVSRAVYVLAGSGATDRYIFKVEKNGGTVTLLDISNITHSVISADGGLSVHDMTYGYGNKTLYISSGGAGLDGELNWVSPPFTHNAKLTKRATTMFKSNWGGQYVTSAPLETMTIGTIDGKDRLMGVTTCAPGFSFDISTVPGTGLLTVTEDFNVHNGYSQKATYMHHDNKDWLFDMHEDKIYRIGKKFLDGSPVTANKYNKNAVKLRDNTGKITASLAADDMKLVTDKVAMMAFWDHYRLVVLESGASGALKMLQVSAETPPPAAIAGLAGQTMEIYPNPATASVAIVLPEGIKGATVNIVSLTGAVVLNEHIAGNKDVLDISRLPRGMYMVNVMLRDGNRLSEKLTVE